MYAKQKTKKDFEKKVSREKNAKKDKKIRKKKSLRPFHHFKLSKGLMMHIKILRNKERAKEKRKNLNKKEK